MPHLKILINYYSMPLFNISYLIIKPNTNDDFNADWQNCRAKLSELSKINSNRIFKINIFIHETEIESFRLKKQFIKKELFEIFGDNCPTFGVVPQSPEKPLNITIEIGIINSSDVRISYRKYDEYHYTVLEKEGFKELWATGVEYFHPGLNTETYSKHAFDALNHILQAENMTFDNIIRQWNFIGNILGNRPNDQSLVQHYQIFNKVRHDYYSRFRSVPDFPAATGIGMNFNGVTLEICAITPNDDNLIYSINNPNQIKPYSYDQRVLANGSRSTKVHITPPQFERAKLLECGEISRLFISGTASIIGQETTAINDIESQTKITIENIETLIKEANRLQNGSELEAFDMQKCSYIRVYVKYFEDIPIVKSICEKHFGDSPANYVQTDICRDGLLVEIEAELNLIH
jgi:enamine deaminase RidA (YjgF/YER057c/UK114 family)